MAIYLIKPQPKYKNNEVDSEENPWAPWYDKTFGFVISADNEKEAREIADEINHSWTIYGDKEYKGLWLDDDYTVCKELDEDTAKGVILKDERWA